MTPHGLVSEPAPANLRATMSDMEGQIQLQWDAVHGASSVSVVSVNWSVSVTRSAV